MLSRSLIVQADDKKGKIFDACEKFASTLQNISEDDKLQLEDLFKQDPSFVNDIYRHFSMFNIPYYGDIRLRRNLLIALMIRKYKDLQAIKVNEESIYANIYFKVALFSFATSGIAIAAKYVLPEIDNMSQLGLEVIPICMISAAAFCLAISLLRKTAAHYDGLWYYDVAQVPNFQVEKATSCVTESSSSKLPENFVATINAKSKPKTESQEEQKQEPKSIFSSVMGFLGYGYNNTLSVIMDVMKLAVFTGSAAIVLSMGAGINAGITIGVVLACKLLYQLSSESTVSRVQSSVVKGGNIVGKLGYCAFTSGFIGLAAYSAIELPIYVTPVLGVVWGCTSFVAYCFNNASKGKHPAVNVDQYLQDNLGIKPIIETGK